MSRTRHHNDDNRPSRSRFRCGLTVWQKKAEHGKLDLLAGIFEAQDGPNALVLAYVDAKRTHHRGKWRSQDQRIRDKAEWKYQMLVKLREGGKFFTIVNPRGGIARVNRFNGHIDYLGPR